MLREQHGLPAWAIGRALRMPRSTVSAWLRRLGLNRPPAAPPVPVSATSGRLPAISCTSISSRWAASTASAIASMAIARAARGASAGSTSTSPSMITVASPTSKSWRTSSAPPARRFCSAPSRGLPRGASRVRRVMSDNGSGYVSRAFRATCAALGLRHLRTRAYTPRTNGKAERFIQTLLREWAYVEPYASSRTRRRDLRPICSITTASDPTRASTIRLPGRGSRALRDEQRA